MSYKVLSADPYTMEKVWSVEGEFSTYTEAEQFIIDNSNGYDDLDYVIEVSND